MMANAGPRIWNACLAIFMLLASGCLSSPADAPAEPVPPSLNAGFLHARATPDGFATAYHWVPPLDASVELGSMQTRRLVLHWAPFFTPGEEDDFSQVMLLVFDLPTAGPNAGKAVLLDASERLREVGTSGFLDPQGNQYEPLNSFTTIILDDPAGHSERGLWLVVGGRAAPEREFGFSLRAGKPTDPHDLRSPVAGAAGFQVAAFHQRFSVPDESYERHTSTVHVERRDVAGLGPGPAGDLIVSTRFESSSGWTLAHVKVSAETRVAHFTLDADYRGRSIAATGGAANVADQLSVGGARVGPPGHLVVRDGAGASSFRLAVRFADASNVHSIQLFKVDLGQSLAKLLGAPSVEQWEIDRVVSSFHRRAVSATP